MAFKEGKFYAIQGKTRLGGWVFLQATNTMRDQRAILRNIANRANRTSGLGSGWHSDEEETSKEVTKHSSPFEVKIFESKDIKLIISNMRHIRDYCSAENVDPNSLRIVTVDVSVKEFIPDEQSEDEIDIRKYALEKLSQSEKDLLKVSHWDVYHKLGDRSMLEDDENG